MMLNPQRKAEQMLKQKFLNVTFPKIFSVKKNLKVFLLLTLPILAQLSCNTTEPTDDNNGQDTTSHNFTFQSWTFGEHSSSVLYDVAIIDENNIWAVGEIYMNDSTGQPDPHCYNGIHWDGKEWELLKIPTLAWNSKNIFWSDPLKTIWTFDKNNIWVTTGSQVINFNGSNWLQHHFLFDDLNDSTFGGINKFWGKDSNTLYGVGDKENIWFFNNEGWNKVSSGLLNFYDIKGSNLDENEIYVVAANQSVNSNKKIFKIENNALKEINVNGIPSSIRGIWFKPGGKYYVVGSGMYSKNNINSNVNWVSFGESVTLYYINSIDGNDLNDIVVCGAYGELLHYNGSSWKSYKGGLEMQAGSYRTIKIKGDFLVAVGYDSPRAVITFGRR